MPGKKVVTNDLPSKITVQLKTSGYRVLLYNFQKQQHPIDIDVNASLRNFNDGLDAHAFPTQSFFLAFIRQLGKDVTIVGFQPDSIVFNFSDRITRVLPVELSLSLRLEKQYDTSGTILIDPQTVEVSGPPSVVNEMTKVITEPLVLRDVKTAQNANVKLVMNKRLLYSKEEVKVTIPIEKFTEGVVSIPVFPQNVAKGYSLKTFPDKVKVRYLVSISKYNKISPGMFRAIIDAKDLEKQHPEKVVVELVGKPDFVREATLESERLDYIMRKE